MPTNLKLKETLICTCVYMYDYVKMRAGTQKARVSLGAGGIGNT